METIEYFDDRFYKLTLEDHCKKLYQYYQGQTAPDTLYLPSVTTLLGIVSQPFLAKWRGDVGNEVADYRSKLAKEKGSRIHEAIAQLFVGAVLKIEDYQQDEWVQLMRFLDWHRALNPQDVKSEHTVFSLEHLYAGTLDIRCRLKGGKVNSGMAKPIEIPEGLYVGDYKSGKGIGKSFYQIAEYVHAEEEMTGDYIAGAFILHLQADTKAGWKMIIRTRQEIDEDFETGLRINYVWKKENQGLTPDIFEMPKEIKL